MLAEPSNLFVYGTLKSPVTFRSVTGLTFEPPAAGYVRPDRPAIPGERLLEAAEAILADHDLVSPDHLYYYAVPQKGRRAHGFLVLDVPADAMAEIARYEGPQYRRMTVKVMTETGPRPAEAFIGSPGHVRRRVTAAAKRDLKSELAFRAKIDRFFQDKAARPYGEVGDEPTYTQAVKELKGPTIRDLLRAHYTTGGLSDFFVSQALAGPIRSVEQLRRDDHAALFADNYLGLLIRQVIFNQFELRIRERFRYEIDRLRTSDRFYDRAISSLVALRMMTQSAELVGMLVSDALNDLNFGRDDLVDFVEWAVVASEHIFEPARAKRLLEWVADHRVGGLLPLGVELKLCNMARPGRDESATVFDSTYDGLAYFEPFALDILTWKLGGHVEPHPAGGESPAGPRGCLAFTPGAFSRDLERSTPLSDDPWVVNQLVGQVIQFYDIRPRSLMLAIQLPRRLAPGAGAAAKGRPADDPARATLPDWAIRCLMAIAGDLGPDDEGRLRVRRLAELAAAPSRSLDLVRIGRRRTAGRDEDVEAAGVTHLAEFGRPVAQHRLPRLDAKLNYEPIILALKGLQLHFRPGDMLNARQMQADPRLEAMFNELVAWGESPSAVEPGEVTRFIDAVRAGLAVERLGRSPHSAAYVNWAMEELDKSIAEFNAQLAVGR